MKKSLFVALILIPFWGCAAVTERDDPAEKPEFGISLMADDPAPAPEPITLRAESRLLWQAPTTNEDGTPLADLSHYEVAVAPEGAQLNQGQLPTASRRVDCTTPECGVTLKEVFGEALSGRQSLWASAVDLSGNRSRWEGNILILSDSVAPAVPQNIRIVVTVEVGGTNP